MKLLPKRVFSPWSFCRLVVGIYLQTSKFACCCWMLKNTLLIGHYFILNYSVCFVLSCWMEVHSLENVYTNFCLSIVVLIRSFSPSLFTILFPFEAQFPPISYILAGGWVICFFQLPIVLNCWPFSFYYMW